MQNRKKRHTTVDGSNLLEKSNAMISSFTQQHVIILSFVSSSICHLTFYCHSLKYLAMVVRALKSSSNQSNLCKIPWLIRNGYFKLRSCWMNRLIPRLTVKQVNIVKFPLLFFELFVHHTCSYISCKQNKMHTKTLCVQMDIFGWKIIERKFCVMF